MRTRSGFGVVVGLALAWAVAIAPTNASATMFNIDLFDHGFGALGPHYGLRLDKANEVFSVEDMSGASTVTLEWDNVANTAVISGTLRSVNPDGTTNTPGVFNVFYELEGVSSVFDGLDPIGFTATGSTNNPLNRVTGPGFDEELVGKQNGAGFAFVFLTDGHRIPGDDSTGVARGWLYGKYTNDWLVRAPEDFVVPEPATAAMLALGLFALARSGRRP